MRTSLNASMVAGQGITPKSGEGRRTYWDKNLSGFGLRVTETGHKTWVLAYRREGRLRWYTIGTYPPLSLADARELAKDKLADAQKGKDPAGEKQELREAETFKVLADRYLSEWAARHKKESSAREDKRNIERSLLPEWGNRRANQVARRDVIALVDGIAARGAAIHANRILALISKIFNFAIGKEVVEANPAHLVPKPGKERRRDRVLSHNEIRAIWRSVEPESREAAALIRILLLSGQRRGEVRGMRWSEIDLEQGWWTIPAERTKNKLTHRVPVLGEVRRILEALSQARGGKTDFVFPGRSGNAPMASPQKLLARIIKRCGVKFRVHDMRRTVGTGLAGLGVDRTVLKKVLNHSEKGDVTAIYDRHGYDDEKRAALAKWDRRVAEILANEPSAPPKVVQLHA